MTEHEQRVHAYLTRKVAEWLADGPEEVVRVLTLWATRWEGALHRLDLGSLPVVIDEDGEID